MCQMPFVVHGLCRMTIVMINPLNLYCSTTVKSAVRYITAFCNEIHFHHENII